MSVKRDLSYDLCPMINPIITEQTPGPNQPPAQIQPCRLGKLGKSEFSRGKGNFLTSTRKKKISEYLAYRCRHPL